jgi:hypothetical protein
MGLKCIITNFRSNLRDRTIDQMWHLKHFITKRESLRVRESRTVANLRPFQCWLALMLLQLVRLLLGVNFTNLLAHSPIAPTVIVLCHSVPPTKLCPTLPLNSTRSYAQLLNLTLYASDVQQYSSICHNCGE